MVLVLTMNAKNIKNKKKSNSPCLSNISSEKADTIKTWTEEDRIINHKGAGLNSNSCSLKSEDGRTLINIPLIFSTSFVIAVLYYFFK